jgi:putative DNA primase/helicase
VPKSSEDATNLMADLASPMSAFIRERCTREPGAEVYRDDLYSDWKVWADDNGHAVTAKSTFGRDLRAVVPGLRDIQKRIDGHMFRYYGGIALLPASPASPPETAGQGDLSEAGNPASGWAASRQSHGAAGREAGHPASNGQVKPQVSDFEASEAPGSALKAQHNGAQPPRFTPPDGPGRCDRCGFHVGTQGHRDDCTSKLDDHQVRG